MRPLTGPRGSRSALFSLGSFGIATIALAAALLIAPRAGAQNITPIDSVANVSGSITSTIGNWSDAVQSLDLAPSIQVQQVIASLSANSFVVANINLALDFVQVETGFSTRTSGSSSDVAIDHDYTLRFSVGSTTYFEFRNGNNTGGFPVATALDPTTSASLVYRLEREGGPEIFRYEAPNVSNGEPGTYASGIVLPGDYVFTVVGSAEALGDPCCVLQNAAARGNVVLDLGASAPVPGLGPVAVVLALFAVAGVGMMTIMRSRRRVDSR